MPVRSGALARALSLSEHQARVAFRALRAVVESAGPPRPRALELLRVARGALAVDDVAANAEQLPHDVASAFETVASRRALVDALVIPACIDGEVDPRSERFVLDLARRSGVRSHWASLLPALRKRSVASVKWQLGRRSPDARRLASRTWKEEGLLGVWRALLFVTGRFAAPALAARFRDLEKLPEGTLGREFFAHVSSRGLTFPGERGGMPERMLHHDIMHVVNGYDTDAAGECELAGFYAAFAEGDAFTFIVIALATFHLGIPVSPAIVTTTRGMFEPARVLEAFLRGRRLRVDVMGRWDYWALMPMPLDEARAALGLGDDADDRATQGGP